MEANPIVQDKVSKVVPTVLDLNERKTLIQERYPQRFSEPATFDFKSLLENLKQKRKELSEHYNRVRLMMDRVGAKDRLENGPPLPMLESSVLNLVILSIVSRITDTDVQMEVARGLTYTTRSLLGLKPIDEQAKHTIFRS